MAQTWAFRQAVSSIAPGLDSYTKALGAVLANSLLVASQTFGSGAGSPRAYSDTVNGAWSATPIVVNDGTRGQSIATGWFLGSAAGTPTVTIQAPAGIANSNGAVVSEYTGLQTAAGTQDLNKTANPAASANPTTGATIGSVASADELVYGFVNEDSAGTAAITGIGGGTADVTIHAGQGPAIVSNVDIAAGDKDGPASGTTSVTFHFSTSQVALIMCLTFKQAASGSFDVAPLVRPSFPHHFQPRHVVA